MLTWHLFRHFLFSKRAGALVRTVARICVFGVAIGVFALVVILSVMNGFNRSIRERLLAVEPHLIVSVEGAEGLQPDQLEVHPVLAQLRAHHEVSAAFWLEMQDVIVRTVEGYVSGGVARGVEKESFVTILSETQRLDDEMAGETAVSPAPIIEEDFELAPDEVYVGIELANQLGVFPGDSVTLIAPEALLLPPGEVPPFERARIAGILRSNFADVDAQSLFYDRRAGLKRLSGTASFQREIEVRLHDPEHEGELVKLLESQGHQVESWRERNSSLFYALKLEKLVVGLLVGLSALIAAFSIVTVMVLLMTQKRRDIGLFLTIGLSARKTQRLFMGVGFVLSAFGLFTGLMFGLITCWLVDRYSHGVLPDIYYDSSIPAEVDPVQIAYIIAFAIVFCFMSSWLATRRFVNLAPAEALKPLASRRQV